MGMEGKLRQVSEFELASYRKTPAKLYADLLAKYQSENFTKFISMTKEFQESPLMKRIQQRAMSGLPPLPEDLDALQKQQEALISENREVMDEVHSDLMGLSKDGLQLSLYKDWHLLHYLLTGKGWETVDTPVGQAIMGGIEIPDVQKVMGYGPARYLSPSIVREVADGLESFPIEQKVESFDPQAAEDAKVYPPMHGIKQLEKDEKEGLIDYFYLLRDFYRDASAKGHAMLLWVE
jgi:Domain of unknown function (DUF1877)